MAITYGSGLKKLRKENNKTQQDVAEETSIARAYISAIENGRRTPTNETLQKILSIYGISYIDFLIDYCGVKRVPNDGMDDEEREHKDQVEQSKIGEEIDEGIKLLKKVEEIDTNGSESESKLLRDFINYMHTKINPAP